MEMKKEEKEGSQKDNVKEEEGRKGDDGMERKEGMEGNEGMERNDKGKDWREDYWMK